MQKKLWERLTPIEKDAINQGADLLRELRDRVAPAWSEQSSENVQNLTTGHCLRELREAQQISQEELAARLRRSQSAISQMEKRGDLLLSTMAQYVEAVGGKLVDFTVRFPDGDVQVAPFKIKRPSLESKTPSET